MKKSEQFKKQMVGFFSRALLIVVLGASAVLLSQRAVIANDGSDNNTAGGNTGVAFFMESMSSRFTISAGGSYSGSFVVKNELNQPYDIKVYAAPFTRQSDDQYTQRFDIETNFTRLSQWIYFEQETYRLGAKGDTDSILTIPFSVQAPGNAVGGGQYAVVFVEASIGGGTINTYPRIGHLLFARVSGDINYAGKVISQNIRNFYWNPPISTSALIENTGNIDFNADVTTSIVNFFGKNNAVEPKKETFMIMPETRRLVTQTWEDAPSLGIFKVKQEISILDEAPVVLERTVIIIPLFLLVIIVIALILLIVWVIAKLKKHKK
jgi:hypothetical protein